MIAIGMTLLRRHGIEPESIGLACQAQGAPWWCDPRQALILAIHFKLIGYVATAAGVAALWRDSVPLGRLAMDLGAAGLVFYSVGWAAGGFVLGLLAVVGSERAK
ncbi:MAG: hypothetical protein HQL56_12680 [Magnetococcales bacterium]|nr:hypothetical protein [Magnetococcales bacterium]